MACVICPRSAAGHCGPLSTGSRARGSERSAGSGGIYNARRCTAACGGGLRRCVARVRTGRAVAKRRLRVGSSGGGRHLLAGLCARRPAGHLRGVGGNSRGKCAVGTGCADGIGGVSGCGGSGLCCSGLRCAASGITSGSLSRGSIGVRRAHYLTSLRAGLPTLHARSGVGDSRFKICIRAGGLNKLGGTSTGGSRGLRGGFLWGAAFGIGPGGRLRGGLRGSGGHGSLEDGRADFLTHLLHGGFLAVERKGQDSLLATGALGAGNHPVLLVNIPGSE